MTQQQQTIHAAAYAGALATVRTLANSSTNLINSVDEDLRTPLHWAVSGKHIPVAEFLLENGAAVNAQDDAGWSPLMIAASVGSAPLTDFLIQNAADPNLPNENKQTPLFYAASKGFPDICSLLISGGAKVNVRDKLNQTALHRVAAKGSIPVLTLLLALENINLDTQDRAGNAPLHIAIENGHAEIARVLIEAGADLDLQNEEKQLPLSLAPDVHIKKFLQRIIESTQNR
ncbi:hypothetical protein HK100_010053 [Physocladia obscura]|uniref:26S proteasome non-ATPase regulatory subunit 10 n=1 Tax=Physocladia obscura TaxID=109957 RepID=A0AAD5T2U8_9FUNG|nr:hypothetical protein HK100_010053 [Physocladia obscura]